MAGLPRESSFMPTIKCSTCARQVEISMMGEHICGGSGAFESMMPSKSVHEKISIVPPIDTATANRSFLRQGQQTPVSVSSGSRSISPKTPNSRPGAGRTDDYFQPRIADDYGSTPPQQSRRPGGYGGFPEPDGYDADPMYSASSPKKQPANLLTRMNTIAPGPFESNRRPSAGERPGTSASSSSFNSGGMAPPRLPRKNGYGGFGPPGTSFDYFQPEPPFGGINRSETFPRPNAQFEAPIRTPSAPGPRPDRLRRPSNDMAGQNGDRFRRPSAGMGPDMTRPPPPRKSIIRPGTSGGKPAINLADEFGIGNPYHSPSESISSSVSASSRPSQPSSQTSPARSQSSRSGRNPSDTSSFDNLMNDLQASMDEIKPKELPSAPLQPPPFDKQGRNDPAIQGGPRGQLRAPWEPSSRNDPAVQGGRRNNFPAPPSPRFASPERLPSSRARDPAVQPARRNCKGCGEAITGKSISSADGRLTGRYHKACFVCTTCREPFQTSEFYVHDDKPYCKRHYHKINGSLCGSCGDGIEGQYLEDESTKKYHVDCFRCGDCGIVLNDGYFEVNGKAFCEKDAWRRVQQPWIAPNGPRIGSNLAPGGRGMGNGLPARPGLPSNNRLGPPGVRPRMEKRMTRLGMM